MAIVCSSLQEIDYQGYITQMSLLHLLSIWLNTFFQLIGKNIKKCHKKKIAKNSSAKMILSWTLDISSNRNISKNAPSIDNHLEILAGLSCIHLRHTIQKNQLSKIKNQWWVFWKVSEIYSHVYTAKLIFSETSTRVLLCVVRSSECVKSVGVAVMGMSSAQHREQVVGEENFWLYCGELGEEVEIWLWQ